MDNVTKLGVRMCLQRDAVLTFAKQIVSTVEVMGLYKSDVMSKLTEQCSKLLPTVVHHSVALRCSSTVLNASFMQ